MHIMWTEFLYSREPMKAYKTQLNLVDFLMFLQFRGHDSVGKEANSLLPMSIAYPRVKFMYSSQNPACLDTFRDWWQCHILFERVIYVIWSSAMLDVRFVYR